MPDLSTKFFARDTLSVARELIGATLVVGKCEGRIVETEAYATDGASHAITRRHQSRIMQETHGRVYVYFIYGMYHCLNFTTDARGPGAVLIRAVEPTKGLDVMRKRRGTDEVRKLARGPGCVCQAFGIDLRMNETRIGDKVKVRARREQPQVATSERIGISAAHDLPWRFFEVDNPHVSGAKRYNVSG